MYAIIEDGGRQFKVQEGLEFDIDFREAMNKGDEIVFDRVLALRDDEKIEIGQPTVAGVTVTAEVVGAQMGPKLVVQKFRRRKNFARRTGHRQVYTRVKVSKIAMG